MMTKSFILAAMFGIVAARAPANRMADGTAMLAFGGGMEYSGCGAHRSCFQCQDQWGCTWLPDMGCIPGDFPSICLPDGVGGVDWNPIGETCNEYSACDTCTNQNGCVWNKGACVYSAGEGCLSDPFNCVNYAWQCPKEGENEEEVSLMDELLGFSLAGEIGIGSGFDGMPDARPFLSLSQHAGVNDGEKDTIQSTFCLPFDAFCVSELDPYRPEMLAPVLDMTDALGIGHHGRTPIMDYFGPPEPVLVEPIMMAPPMIAAPPVVSRPSYGVSHHSPSFAVSHMTPAAVHTSPFVVSPFAAAPARPSYAPMASHVPVSVGGFGGHHRVGGHVGGRVGGRVGSHVGGHVGGHVGRVGGLGGYTRFG